MCNPIPWDEKIVKDVQIAAVHALLIGVERDANIDIGADRQVIVKTCEFARRIADEQNHPIVVICHLSSSPTWLRKFGLYESAVFFMKDLANAYQQLEFAIENVPMMLNPTKTLNIEFRPINFTSTVEFVNDVNHPRVGTCLDTCHAMMDINTVGALSSYLPMSSDEFGGSTQINMASFFQANQKTIKWMHLANAKGHGFNDNHGLPFTKSENDVETLSCILRLYDKYQYHCPISIEVRELDYSNAINFAETFVNIKQLLKN